MQNVEGRTQRDVGRREEFSLGIWESSHDGGRSSQRWCQIQARSHEASRQLAHLVEVTS